MARIYGYLLGPFVFYLLCVQTTLAQLQDACNHNEFRCADGSGCLKTEKLCDGVEDCLISGEDEKGNGQWDCTRETLGTQCSPSEIKCRLGGCVPLEKKCDGVADCWGGNDEAKDLCNARPPVRNRNRPQLIRVNSTIPSESNPQVPPSPSPTPIHIIRYPQDEEVHKEQNNYPVSAPSQPPPPPPPPPPSSVPAEPENEPEVQVTIERKPKGCPQLPKEAGVEILCYFAPRAKTFNCNRIRSPVGSEATYSCSNYWSSPKTGPKTTTRTCLPNGTWSKKNSSWRCSLKCGIPGLKATGFIVGGTTSIPNMWPWHVALYNEDPPNSGKFNYFCGGTLISRRAVLTAAHCSTEQRSTRKRTDTIIAIPGKFHRSYDKNDESDRFAQKRQVIDIDVPDYYNSVNYEADIAIMWLSEDVDITEGVRPVCLPHKNDDVQAGFDDINKGILAGWGRSNGREFPEKLQEADIPVVDIQTCRKAHPSLAMLVRTTTFCAGYRNGTTACDGDSGGGLVFENPLERDKWTIKGVVSAGIQRRGGGCDEHYYTVFTKVPQYREWIDGLLSNKILA